MSIQSASHLAEKREADSFPRAPKGSLPRIEPANSRQGMTGRNIFTIGTYAVPLFLLMCLAVVLVAIFPGIALAALNDA
jgi:hypothetical protein